MKTISRSKLLLSLGLLTLVTLPACKSYEEVPPRVREDVSRRVYRIPDPTPLTPEEEAELKGIQDEYNDSNK